MSYILDALKRAEQERGQYETPHIHLNYPTPHSGKKRNKVTGLVVAIIVFFVLVLSGVGLNYSSVFLFDKKRADSGISESSLPDRSVVNSTQKVPEKVDVPVDSSAKKDQLSDGHTVVDSSMMSSEVTRDNEQAAIEFTLPYKRELPENIQAELPALSYNGHTYSINPLKRLIIINNKILREKDRVNTDLTLHEITRDGVVLNYNGVLFQDIIEMQ